MSTATNVLLPFALPDCIEGLTAWVISIERKRLRVVA